jgi:hypothetical protein
MRKRGGLKSPVRENCTPGSVRGPSGNWRSYRDGSHWKEADEELVEGRRAKEDETGLEHPPSLRTEGPEWRPMGTEQSEKRHRGKGSFRKDAPPNPPFHRIAARWRF